MDTPLAQNQRVDAAIRVCLKLLPVQMAPVFERKFKEQRSDKDLVMHTFRELLLGAYLAGHGEKLEYEMPRCGKTPDWTLLDEDGGAKAVLELTNFHSPHAEEMAMRRSLGRGEMYCEWQPDPTRRLYQSIQTKADIYADCQDVRVPYVVGLYGDFLAAVEIDELREVLYKAYDGGVFQYSRAIAGVLFFEEHSGAYRFQYFPNPAATAPIAIKGGTLLDNER